MTEWDRETWLKETACEVCSRKGVIGVASSSMGPISLAFCYECASRQAEPEWLFGMTWDTCDQGKNVADWVLGMVTWRDGKYITWDEFDAIAKTEPERWAMDDLPDPAEGWFEDGEPLDFDFGEVNASN